MPKHRDNKLSGYRFFRDDAILDNYKDAKYCDRCGQMYYPDEIKDRLIGDNLCEPCICLIRSRKLELEKTDRKTCPVDSSKYIFVKDLKVSARFDNNRESWQKKHRSSKQYEY